MKKTNRKSWLVEIVVAIALGGLASVLGYAKEHSVTVGDWVCIAVPVVYLVASVVLCLLAWKDYRLAEQRLQKCTADDEDELERIEKQLEKPGRLLLINSFLSLFFLSAMIELVEHRSYFADKELLIVICTIAAILVFTGLQLIISHKTVELIKKMNPEKRGFLLDEHFQEQWEASSDEGELLHMYKAGYHAYWVTMRWCSALWMVALVMQFCLDTGMLPVIMVSIIWLVLGLSNHE